MKPTSRPETKPERLEPTNLPRLLTNHRHLEDVAITDLIAAERLTRRHPDKQIVKLMASIERFGFLAPILIDAKNCIITGHAVVEAARRLKMTHVPALRIEHLSDAEIRAYRIAANRLAEDGEWDEAELILEFQDILELDFDLEITGFEIAEIDLIIEGAGTGEADPADAPVEPAAQVVSRTGDLWVIGEHQLLCGDALAPASYTQLLDEEQARMVFADPPYNVRIDGHVCGLGRIKHREFAMASGEMFDDEFEAFLVTGIGAMATNVTDGGLLYVAMDWRGHDKLVRAAKSVGLRHINTCVWDKGSGRMGPFYRSQHEFFGVFKKGKAPHLNNIQLGKYGRNRTNVWSYPGVNALSPERLAELAMHPTVKPVALIADAILDCTRRKDIILDGFGGSGSTMIAAERVGRRARLIEIDAIYVDTTIRRYQQVYGVEAIHAESGLRFSEVAARRAEEPTGAIVAEDSQPDVDTRESGR